MSILRDPDKNTFVEKMPEFNDTPGYEALARVLTLAYSQSAHGKGANRHAKNRPFHAQPITAIPHLLGGDLGTGGLAYQVIKKTQEAATMAERELYNPSKHELLGAIVYAAALYLFVEAQQQAKLQE